MGPIGLIGLGLLDKLEGWGRIRIFFEGGCGLMKFFRNFVDTIMQPCNCFQKSKCVTDV